MQVIFETGGKQYTAEKGTQLFIEKLDAAADSTVTFDKVLAVLGGKETVFGAPYVDGAAITAKVLKNGKAKKITVFTYRPKKDSKRKLGHRQPYTKVEITDIVVGTKKSAAAEKAEASAEEAPKAARKPAAKKTSAKKEAGEKAEKKTTAKKETGEKKPAAKKPAAKKPAAKKTAEEKAE